MRFKERLLSPLVTPALTFNNRVAMAPMSRHRSPYGIVSDSVAVYYAQRAGAGLIIAENSAVAANGLGYWDAPGIYNDVQKTAWKKVVDAVHAQGGTIFIQLVHTGRIGHPLNQEGHAPLVGPSAVRPAGTFRIQDGSHLPMPTPEVLSTEAAEALVQAHIDAAKVAIDLGFDGVEVHGAHGFLPEQFLNPHTNLRTDKYGGSIENRSRFLLEIVEGTVKAIGKERTGIRLSPFGGLNDLAPFDEEAATHHYITDALQALDILYIHLSDQSTNGHPPVPREHLEAVRRRFSNIIILAGGYTADSAEDALEAGLADMIAFGRPYIANPDLVERFRHNAPLNVGDVTTFYNGSDEGFIDYPVMNTLQTAPVNEPSTCA